MMRRFGNRIYFKTRGKRSHNLANKMAQRIRQNGINARVIRSSNGSSIYVAPKYNSRFEEYDRLQKQVDSEAFSSNRRPKEIRKILMLKGRASAEEVGISVGFVTRSEAADILMDYGIYPTATEFDFSYMDELRTKENMNRIDPTGLASAELAAKKRDEFLKNGKARIEPIFDATDISWSIRDPEEYENSVYGWGQFNDRVKANPGQLVDMEYEDLYDAYIDWLSEEVFSMEEIDEQLEYVSMADLWDLFEIEDEKENVRRDEEDRDMKPRIIMQKITGYRKGDEIGEWNEFEPIDSKIRLKRNVDLSQPGVMEAAKRLIWNLEFEEPERD